MNLSTPLCRGFGEELAKVEMRRVTRVFVRRQANWFKESDEKIHWFEAGQENLEEEVRRTILKWLNAKAESDSV